MNSPEATMNNALPENTLIAIEKAVSERAPEPRRLRSLHRAPCAASATTSPTRAPQRVGTDVPCSHLSLFVVPVSHRALISVNVAIAEPSR